MKHWKFKQSEPLKDPEIDLIRIPFLSELSRMCLCIALGEFLCVVPLYYLFANSIQDPVFKNYIVVLTGSALALCVIAFLCRFVKLRTTLSYTAFLVLFVQTAYVYFTKTNLVHPINALFPILCFLAPPIFGRRSAYVVGIATALIPLVYCIVHQHLPGMGADPSSYWGAALIILVILLSAYISEVMWGGVLKREQKLKQALKEVEHKAQEMESWVYEIGDVSQQINAGRTATFPDAPPHQIFEQLTENLESMQNKLKTYFGDQLLKDRLSSIGVLATGVAHELNTPLTSLRFLIAKDKKLPKKNKDSLLEELDRMGEITHGLLSFGRKAELECLDLNKIIRDSEKFFGRSHKKKVAIKLQLHKGSIPIWGCTNEIQQVLLNLLQNSWDATQGKPAKISIHSEVNDTVAVLTITDNGCGIEKEQLRQIMDPFFTTKSPERGTGLGLFLVHQILDRHNSSITVESEKKQGH